MKNLKDFAESMGLLELHESGSGLNAEDFNAALVDAQLRGFIVHQGNSNTLLLDIDSPSAQEQFDRVFPAFERNVTYQKVERWNSKSGNSHYKITLEEDFTALERVAMQAALGSDGVKELLAIFRIQNGIEEPSILFQPKDSVIKVVVM